MTEKQEEYVVDGEAREIVPADPLTDRLLPALAVKPKDHPVVKSLLRATPKAARMRRQGPGGKTFTYAPWSYYARVMTETFGPFWSVEVVEVEKVPTNGGKKVEVIARIKLVTPFGSMPGVGSMDYYPANANSSYADCESGAMSNALKRAASRWGIGIDLYADTEEGVDEVEAKEAEAAFKEKVRALGLTHGQAVEMLSGAMAGGDMKALASIRDCLDATGAAGAAAWRELLRVLEEATRA